MGRRGEVPAHHIGEEAGGGPDPDAGHAGQDGVKRVGGDPLLDLGADLSALLMQGLQLRAQARQHQGG